MTEIEILQSAIRGELLKMHTRKGRSYSVNGIPVNRRRVIALVRRGYLEDEDRAQSSFLVLTTNGWSAWYRWHDGIRQ